MNSEFFNALDLLEKEKGIPKEYMMEKVTAALTSAFKRELGGTDNVKIVLDPNKKDMKVYQLLTVVAEVTDPETEVTQEQAIAIKADKSRKCKSRSTKVGAVLELELDTKSFRRLSAQAAKQVIIQGIREAEQGMVYDEFTSKEHEILTGIITRIDPRSGAISLRITSGGEYTDAYLSANEQVKGETYAEGTRLKVYVVEVRKATKGPQVLISRTHPGLVKRLFELEVPEIYDGTVEVKSIAR